VRFQIATSEIFVVLKHVALVKNGKGLDVEDGIQLSVAFMTGL
jgi:hypothetical protein